MFKWPPTAGLADRAAAAFPTCTAEFSSVATWLACISWDFLSRDIWIWPGRPSPFPEPEMDEVSIFRLSVDFPPNLRPVAC